MVESQMHSAWTQIAMSASDRAVPTTKPVARCRSSMAPKSWHWLLGRSASDSGRLRQGAGGYHGGVRRGEGPMLTTLGPEILRSLTEAKEAQARKVDIQCLSRPGGRLPDCGACWPTAAPSSRSRSLMRVMPWGNQSDSQFPTPFPRRFPSDSQGQWENPRTELGGFDDKTISTPKVRRVDFGDCGPPI
jgi:hypothetical protein